MFDMSNTAVLPRIGHSFDVAVHRFLRFVGLDGRARRQRATYIQLSNLSDQQLDDIGLTRGLIETVVLQGPCSIQSLRSGVANPSPANTDDRDARRFA